MVAGCTISNLQEIVFVLSLSVADNLKTREIFWWKCRGEHINLGYWKQQGTFWLRWPVASMVWILHFIPRLSFICASVEEIVQKVEGKNYRPRLFIPHKTSQRVIAIFNRDVLCRDISKHKKSRLNAQTRLLHRNKISRVILPQSAY
jgi:hypothetical protein